MTTTHTPPADRQPPALHARRMLLALASLEAAIESAEDPTSADERIEATAKALAEHGSAAVEAAKHYLSGRGAGS